jgi:ribosomal protein L7/L12
MADQTNIDTINEVLQSMYDKDGDKVQMIKMLRRLFRLNGTNPGLKECKDYVDKKWFPRDVPNNSIFSWLREHC